jgi:hypothetical protein
VFFLLIFGFLTYFKFYTFFYNFKFLFFLVFIASLRNHMISHIEKKFTSFQTPEDSYNAQKKEHRN